MARPAEAFLLQPCLRCGRSQMCGATAPPHQPPPRDSSVPLSSGRRQSLSQGSVCGSCLFFFLYLRKRDSMDNKAGAHHIWQLMKGLRISPGTSSFDPLRLHITSSMCLWACHSPGGFSRFSPFPADWQLGHKP